MAIPLITHIAGLIDAIKYEFQERVSMVLAKF